VPIVEALIAFIPIKRDNRSSDTVRSADSAIEAIRHGAYDWLLKPVDLQSWTARSASSGSVQHVSAGDVPDDRAGQEAAIDRQARAAHEVGLALSEMGDG
jgi:hypothetical protein